MLTELDTEAESTRVFESPFELGVPFAEIAFFEGRWVVAVALNGEALSPEHTVWFCFDLRERRACRATPFKPRIGERIKEHYGQQVGATGADPLEWMYTHEAQQAFRKVAGQPAPSH